MTRLRSQRYLGIDLSGAKNNKTSVAVIEFFPEAKKIFLLDIQDRMGQKKSDDSDIELINFIKEEKNKLKKVGINAPLQYPLCVHCPRKKCPLPKKCTVPPVKWGIQKMNALSKKKNIHEDTPKIKSFTPYTQRAVEIWLRYEVFPKINKNFQFEIDETLGGNKGPLTARAHFLQKHLGSIETVEVLPKLTLAILVQNLSLNQRYFKRYRDLEEGTLARRKLLDELLEWSEIFVYEKDIKKLCEQLSSFDAFLAAYTALLSDLNETVTHPKNYPLDGGWIEYPKIIK
ncbi:MAG: hypothetical protein CL678_17980 [Bdellovibrionaceae bacterium]|nr:hypothetical protein [Pseudobdellovibrionaceae bacterium]|tara:strand:+ start:5945 stop:6805 length:861 start_codon:yes stop_codon:yes gene_type:complete